MWVWRSSLLVQREAVPWLSLRVAIVDVHTEDCALFRKVLPGPLSPGASAADRQPSEGRGSLSSFSASS